MKKIYIAGAMTPRGYRPDTHNAAIEYLLNIRDMLLDEQVLRDKGYVPFNPARDLLTFLSLPQGAVISEPQIKAESMAWLEDCDCIVFLPGWKTSAGCLAEEQRASELGMPCYYSLSEVPDVRN